MAWSTPSERRADLEQRAAKAEAKAEEHRGKEKAYRLQGKTEKADAAAKTAHRQEMIATNHRQEIQRLDLRVQREARQTLSASFRSQEMDRAQKLAEAAVAVRPEVDPLLAYMEALEQAVNLETLAEQRETNAATHKRAGYQVKADIALRGAASSRARAAEWRAEAMTIWRSTDRDLPREAKTTIAARRRIESQAKNEEKRRAHIGVITDLRTAAGQRDIASGGRDKGKPVASLRDYASMIRKPQDRTSARLEAMHDFDNLCGTADSGLFPEPRFESESSSGKGPGSEVMAHRAAGLLEMERLRGAIGAINADMLRAWIYERQTITAIVRNGFGTEKTAGALLLAAVDALAMHFKRTAGGRSAGSGSAGRPHPRPAGTPAHSTESAQSR